MNRRRHNLKYGQYGQSMTELIIASFVLIPFFLIVPMLIQYGDIAMTSRVATRFNLFEASMYYKDDNKDAIQKEIYKPHDKAWNDFRGKKLMDVSQVDPKKVDGDFNKWAYKYQKGAGFYLPYKQTRTWTQSNVNVILNTLPWEKAFSWEGDFYSGRSFGQIRFTRLTSTTRYEWSTTGSDRLEKQLQNPGVPFARRLGNGNVPNTEGGSWNLMQVYTGQKWTGYYYPPDGSDPYQIEVPFPYPPLKGFVEIFEFSNPKPEIWADFDVELVPKDRLM